MPTVISDISKTNIKLMRSLHKHKFRESNGLFVAEGIKTVNEALLWCNDKINFAVIDKDFCNFDENKKLVDKLHEVGINVYKANQKDFCSVSDTSTPQGIIAVMRKFNYVNANAFNGDFFVFADCVQDPGNIGSIIRTADAAKADGVILTAGCADIYSPKVVRATMGSIFHIPVYYYADIAYTIKKFKAQGFKVVSGHLKAKKYFFEENYTGKTVVIAGNESKGISSTVEELSDALVKIPMPGHAESLNVSVATAVLMFEIVRQRLSN